MNLVATDQSTTSSAGTTETKTPKFTQEELDRSTYLQLLWTGKFETEIEPIIKLETESGSSKITVGRALNNNIHWPSLRMSRYHCEFYEAPDGKWSVKNLSANGLLINKIPLGEGQTQELNDLDTIAFLLTGEPRYKINFPKPMTKDELEKMKEELFLAKKQLDMLEIEQHFLDFQSVQYEITSEDEHQLKQAIADSESEKNEVVKKLLDTLNASFKCPMCTTILVQPTILGCGHTFCEACIARYQNNGRVCPRCTRANASLFTVKHVVLRNFLNNFYPKLPEKYLKERNQEIREHEIRFGASPLVGRQSRAPATVTSASLAMTAGSAAGADDQMIADVENVAISSNNLRVGTAAGGGSNVSSNNNSVIMDDLPFVDLVGLGLNVQNAQSSSQSDSDTSEARRNSRVVPNLDTSLLPSLFPSTSSRGPRRSARNRPRTRSPAARISSQPDSPSIITLDDDDDL